VYEGSLKLLQLGAMGPVMRHIIFSMSVYRAAADCRSGIAPPAPLV
jgi:hypothetical protein